MFEVTNGNRTEGYWKVRDNELIQTARAIAARREAATLAGAAILENNVAPETVAEPVQETAQETRLEVEHGNFGFAPTPAVAELPA